MNDGVTVSGQNVNVLDILPNAYSDYNYIYTHCMNFVGLLLSSLLCSIF